MWFPVLGSIPYATHYFQLTASIREFLTQFATPLGETAGVYHFGLECPSGKLLGFLAFVENQHSNRETASVLRGCVEKRKISTQAGRFPPRPNLKLGYSVKGMLDIRLLREKPDFVRERLATRSEDLYAQVDEGRARDAQRRRAETE